MQVVIRDYYTLKIKISQLWTELDIIKQVSKTIEVMCECDYEILKIKMHARLIAVFLIICVHNIILNHVQLIILLNIAC